MRIITYVWVGPEAPPVGAEVIARIRCAMVGQKGKVIEDWHPVIIHGRDEGDARERAQAWWDEQLAKAATKEENAAKRAEARRKREAA